MGQNQNHGKEKLNLRAREEDGPKLPASTDPILARVDIGLFLFERFVDAVEDFVYGAEEAPEGAADPAHENA